MMKQANYEVIEHTADIAVRVHADNLQELFSCVAEALFDQIAPVKTDRELTERQTISLEADDCVELLHDWLAELNFLHQTRHEIYRKFEIRQINDNQIEATARGHAIDPERDEIEVEIKAVTYHQLKIEQDGEGWHAMVVFDI